MCLPFPGPVPTPTTHPEHKTGPESAREPPESTYHCGTWDNRVGQGTRVITHWGIEQVRLRHAGELGVVG